jgi:hypothetical protein
MPRAGHERGAGAVEVECSDDDGQSYAELALESDQLLVLHHRLA